MSKLVAVKCVSKKPVVDDCICFTSHVWQGAGDIQYVSPVVARKLEPYNDTWQVLWDNEINGDEELPAEPVKPVEEERYMEFPMVDLEAMDRERLVEYGMKYLGLDFSDRPRLSTKNMRREINAKVQVIRYGKAA